MKSMSSCHFFFHIESQDFSTEHFGDAVYDVPGRSSAYVFLNVFSDSIVALGRGKNTGQAHFQNKMAALVPIKMISKAQRP